MSDPRTTAEIEAAQKGQRLEDEQLEAASGGGGTQEVGADGKPIVVNSFDMKPMTMEEQQASEKGHGVDTI